MSSTCLIEKELRTYDRDLTSGNLQVMIKELEIEGFKSFGTPAEKLYLEKLNFAVGANASGKTNLLSALKFLQNSVRQDVEFAVNDLGGNLEVRNKLLRQRDEPKPVRIRVVIDTEVEFHVSKKQQWKISGFEYELTLDLREQLNIPTIKKEVIFAKLSTNGETRKFTLQRDQSHLSISDPLGPGDGKLEISVPEQEKTRLALGVGFFAPACVILKEEINRWRFFNITPDVARQPCRETADCDLGPSGENLAVILHKIESATKKPPQDFDAIVSGLRGVVPGFRSIKTRQLPVEGKWAFQLVEDKIKGFINPASASDGTIRLLTLLVITTWMARTASFVAIEEPENGLHPHLSEHIVQILREASQKTQLLVTTHNPSFLDHLKPSEVILCDKVDGFTKLRRASDVTEIESFRKHFDLGELWVQGTLGGIP